MQFATYVEIVFSLAALLGAFWLGTKAGPKVAVAEADIAKIAAVVKADILKVEAFAKPAPAPQAAPPATPAAPAA